MTDIELLHAAWCREASRDPKEPLRGNIRIWERAYVDFLSKGYTVDDLVLVVRHIKYVNKRHDHKFSLRQNLIFDFEYMRFDSLLSEAHATNRNKRPAADAKQTALAELRPVVDPEQASTLSLTSGHHVSDFIRRP